jgi:hypothetical protein
VSAEHLAVAMTNAGIDADLLAERIHVDARTARRWVNGTVPASATKFGPRLELACPGF